jgi:hypothetical protein
MTDRTSESGRHIYVTLRLDVEDERPSELHGVVERLGLTDKRTFADTASLVACLREWAAPRERSS